MLKEQLEELILNIAERTNIRLDILEKDYYVCLVLKEIANLQKSIPVYFKGGTALYKILNEMHRFSEDIDLTVYVDDLCSNSQKQKRLKKATYNYIIPYLEFNKNEKDEKRSSITATYNYTSLFPLTDLYKSEKIQIEATSFTISEPTKTYTIEPLIFKYATLEEKEILINNFKIGKFDIEIITLERIFIDKVFAAEYYFNRQVYQDFAKHIYDLTVLLKETTIIDFINNENKMKEVIQHKRKEELARLGGIDKNIAIKDFNYLNHYLPEEIEETFNQMQNIYIFDNKYKVTYIEIKKTITSIKDLFYNLNI